MRVVIPFDARQPKTRLADVLTADERRVFADHLLADVCDAVRETGHEPELLVTGPIGDDRDDLCIIVDDRPLTDAVNAVLETGQETAIVMADLGLVTADVLGQLFDAESDVVIAPGIGGGTNALVVRHEDFTVDYHGVSYQDHRDRCRTIGATVDVVDSFRLAVDIDEPMDLVELLLHGDGDACDWLRDRFELTTGNGDQRRVTVSRR